ncbi:mitochondrial 54S ribosomal protein uL1m [Lipomyces oligophaga]|uniref:mitochondrial 54S ribosomal protein uL1m n=1 Tax=Lipomyces oligophaga TaxID=45792 RepID=UPI0034CD2C71
MVLRTVSRYQLTVRPVLRSIVWPGIGKAVIEGTSLAGTGRQEFVRTAVSRARATKNKQKKKGKEMADSSSPQSRAAVDQQIIRNYDRSRALVKQQPIFQHQVDLATAYRYLISTAVGRPDPLYLFMIVKMAVHPRTQIIRGSLTLPHDTGYDATLCLTEDSEERRKLTKLGVKLVGGESLITSIEQGLKLKCTRALANSKIAPSLRKVAKILGQHGILPSDRQGTISNNLVDLYLQSRKQSFYLINKSGTKIPVARTDMSFTEFQDNVNEAVRSVKATVSLANVVYKPIIQEFILFTPIGPSMSVPFQ